MQDANVLVIENEGAVSTLLKEVLESFEPQYNVQVAERLGDALLFLQANPTQYRLITLDLGLADARNLQGLKLLKEKFPLIPVGIITATASHELQLEAEDEGAIFYITKPFPSARILHAVIARAVNIYWIQYGICREAWEAEQHVKLEKQMHEEAIESPRLKKWQFWAGVVTAIVGAATATATLWKGALNWVVELWQRVMK